MDLNTKYKMWYNTKLFAWLNSLFILVLSGIKLTVDAAMLAIMLALILVTVDFVVGIMASKYEGNQLTSRKMRWSFAKLLVYVCVIAFTIVLGAGLHAIELSMDPEAGSNNTTLYFTLYCVKIMAYAVCWIELVSIVENLNRRFRDNLFLEFLHWVISVEFIKKIPKLSEFLKEKDEKKMEE